MTWMTSQPEWLQARIRRRFGDQPVQEYPLPQGYERGYFIAVDVVHATPHGTPVVFALTPHNSLGKGEKL